jgi:hypothetical protein
MRSAITQHGRPNAIAENKADDHAYKKLHFLYPAPPKERARRVVDQPSPNNRVSKGVGKRGPEANVCGVALFLLAQYIAGVLSRVRNSRGRPLNAPAAFIHACQPTVANSRYRWDLLILNLLFPYRVKR